MTKLEENANFAISKFVMLFVVFFESFLKKFIAFPRKISGNKTKFYKMTKMTKLEENANFAISKFVFFVCHVFVPFCCHYWRNLSDLKKKVGISHISPK